MTSFNGCVVALLTVALFGSACGVGEEGASEGERETAATRVSNSTCEAHGVPCDAPDYCERYMLFSYRCMSGDPEVSYKGCARFTDDEGCDSGMTCVRYDEDKGIQGTVQHGVCRMSGCIGTPSLCMDGYQCRHKSASLWNGVTYEVGTCVKTSWTTRYYGCMADNNSLVFGDDEAEEFPHKNCYAYGQYCRMTEEDDAEAMVHRVRGKCTTSKFQECVSDYDCGNGEWCMDKLYKVSNVPGTYKVGVCQ